MTLAYNSKAMAELAIYTNNTEKVRVDRTGKVGIGTVDPDTKLHVNSGELKVRSSDDDITTSIGAFYANNNTQGISIGYSRIAAIGSNTNQGISLVPKGTGNLSISSDLEVSGTSRLSNNVGIGVEPDTNDKLTVYGGELTLQTEDNEKDQGLLFRNSGDAYTWRIYRSNAGDHTADLNIASGKDADYQQLSDRILINKDGKVGIGTTAVGSNKLTVGGDTSITGSLSMPGNQKIQFEHATPLNDNLKLQLWDKYGFGINSGTLFYTAQGKHSWRDGNSVERMNLTTGEAGGLTVKGTGNSSFSGGLGVGISNPNHTYDDDDKLTVKDGDIRIEGGYYRRLKIISDEYWAGIELVAREQNGESGNPHIDFTHGDLDTPNYGVRLYAPNNDSLLIQGGTLGFVDENFKPMQLKKVTASGDNPRIDTGYSSSDWVVIVAGTKMSSNNESDAQYAYPYISSNKWYVAADVVGPQDSNWTITVLAIRRNFTKVIGSF